MNIFTKLKSFILPVIFISTILSAQTISEKLDNREKQKLIHEVSNLVRANYVFSDLGEKYGQEILEVFESGKFDEINDPKEFGDSVTTVLHNLTKDKHFYFRLVEKSDLGEDEQGSLHHPVRFYSFGKKEHLGIFRLDWIENEIGYMDYRRFYYQSEAKEELLNAMNFLSSANAIIIDLRENQGGTGRLIPLLCSYFLPYPTQLTGTFYKVENITEEWWTLEKVEGKRLLDVPLFILISNKTFSAAEYLAYDLKVRQRATLIGEPTKGGAHSVDLFPVGDSFEIYIPTSRAINPVTGSNWEGTGVIPDVNVPSETALDTAIVLAKIAAEEYGKKKDAEMMKIINKMQKQLDRAELLFKNDKDTDAVACLDSAFQTGSQTDVLNEFFIDVLAYYYSSNKLNKMSIEILKKQIELFPESSNAYESLAWEYYKQDKKKLAKKYFLIVLDLDKNNSFAKEILKRLE